MADNRQFGKPKVLQFGDKTVGNQPGDSGHCAQCEAMLADALDGTLSTEDQSIFDVHMAECGPCSQMLADARRGAAFLEILRTPRPEPSAALLERILAQTSGAEAGRNTSSSIQHMGFGPATLGQEPSFGVAAATPGYAVAGAGNVIPFRRRAVAAVRGSAFGQILLQPRLAMTAAMAFFSIALTLDLTGVRLQDLRASDLRPSSLKRDFYSGKARVAQYYDGLRVVYELESRVHDLQSATDNDATSGSRMTPQNTAPASTPDSQPGSQTPAAQPGQNGPDKQNPGGKPNQKQHAPGSGPASGPATGPALGPAPKSGTSRRENFERNLRLVAATESDPLLDGPIGIIGGNPRAVVTTCFAKVVVCGSKKVKGSLV